MERRTPSSPLRNSVGMRRTLCAFCEAEIGLLKRKRKCKMCEKSFCSDCCCVRANYPIGYGFTSAKWACNECAPEVFNLRCSADAIASPKIERSPNSPKSKKSAALIEGSYHTCEEGDVHMPFKMADPVCRMFFRASGMYLGGKFDRSPLQRAMKLNKALVKLPSVGEVKRHYISVPTSVQEESWKLDKLYKRPPFIKRRRRKKSSKSKQKKKKKTVEKVIKADIGSRSDSSDVDSDTIELEWSDISVFVYKPKNIGEESLPVVIWYHGGGFCIGSIEDSMYEWICRTFCKRIRCIVVSVEYRLAPEFVFPVPLEDAYWALLWVYHKGKELFNADVSRISVAGDSAGGSLSALMCIMSKLRNGPKLTHQVLVYPCLANPCNDSYESQVTYKNGPLLTRQIMEWFMKQCLGDSSAEPEGLFPLLFEDEFLLHLPPATIINAQHDPLLDHGTEYFRKLQRAGIPVRHTVYSKSIHGFFGSQIGESDAAVMEAVTALKTTFQPLKITESSEKLE